MSSSHSTKNALKSHRTTNNLNQSFHILWSECLIWSSECLRWARWLLWFGKKKNRDFSDPTTSLQSASRLDFLECCRREILCVNLSSGLLQGTFGGLHSFTAVITVDFESDFFDKTWYSSQVSLVKIFFRSQFWRHVSWILGGTLFLADSSGSALCYTIKRILSFTVWS